MTRSIKVEMSLMNLKREWCEFRQKEIKSDSIWIFLNEKYQAR